MTTIVYNRATKTIAGDSQYTSDDATIFRMNKIERLSDGRFFLGSGHSYPLVLSKRWAETNFAVDDEPEWDKVLENAEDMRFGALIISADGNTVQLIDNELAVVEVIDKFLGVGSGAAHAIAALEAGASIERALEIACDKDINSSFPINVHRIGVD